MERKVPKILFVITKSNWGGAQRYVFDLATSLPKGEFLPMVALGHSPTGETFGQPGLLAEKLRAAGIPTRTIGAMQRDISAGNDLQSFFELVNLFKAEKPDVVHLNSSKAGGLGSLAARVAGVPKIIFTAHGWPFLEKRNAFVLALIWLSSWVTALLSHKVITISEFDTRIARRMPLVGGKVVQIYNGIGQMDLASGEKIRSAFPAGAHITGTIGELNKNKNQITLIEQAKNNTEMYVAIVGEGENRQMLEEKRREYNLGDRVKLFGFMPASEVLKGFDVFALPSLKEGLPYVLLEAKAAGLPIEANRVGGVGEILDSKTAQDFTLEEMVKKTIEVYTS
jgi:glycosyltransferase involved in cell wall biosynthesis